METKTTTEQKPSAEKATNDEELQAFAALRIDGEKLREKLKWASDKYVPVGWHSTAAWHSAVLPSGHSGERADVLIKLTIGKLSGKGRYTPNDPGAEHLRPRGISRHEAEELMTMGRVIVLKADRKFRDGGMSWENFILQRLRWDLPKNLKKLRKNAIRLQSDHFVIGTTSLPNGRIVPVEIALDFEDQSQYAAETLETTELSPATKRSSVEDRLMIAEGTASKSPADKAQRLVDKILRGVSASDCTILMFKFGLDNGVERSVTELAQQIGGSRTSAHRRLKKAEANARETILLSEQRLTELTGETDPDRQMAVLRCLDISFEPPKHWMLHSRAPDGRLKTSTVQECGVKPMVVWLADIRSLMHPERVEQLEKKLTQELEVLLNSKILAWQEAAYSAVVGTVSQALQCLARIRGGKFKL